MWRQFLPIFGMQALLTVGIAALAGWFAGLHGAFSALLGGLIGALGGVVFAWMAARNAARVAHQATQPQAAGGDVAALTALYGALRAELLKLVVMGGLLGLVLALYQQVVLVGLIGAFIVSVLTLSMALFVRVP